MKGTIDAGICGAKDTILNNQERDGRAYWW